MNYRLATPEDANSIAALIAATWDTQAHTDWIATVISQPRQCIWLAAENDVLAGFCGAFPTSQADASLRWEVDLLAVRPDMRGRGIGRQLVARATDTGCRLGALCLRALVAVGNTASERCFAANGYAPMQQCDLWVGAPVAYPAEIALPDNVSLLTVDTLNYRGVWIEGRYDMTAMRAGQHLAAREGRNTVGAVIPSDAYHEAEQAGFSHIDTYRWWSRLA